MVGADITHHPPKLPHKHKPALEMAALGSTRWGLRPGKQGSNITDRHPERVTAGSSWARQMAVTSARLGQAEAADGCM